MSQHPCAECPFTRKIAPGFLGGSPPETFIGQLVGPFVIPCHCAKGYDQHDPNPGRFTQCAGAAIMRANEGCDGPLPDSMLKLPPDRVTVFATFAEFYAHHGGETVEAARAYLTGSKLLALGMRELADARARTVIMPEQK